MSLRLIIASITAFIVFTTKASAQSTDWNAYSFPVEKIWPGFTHKIVPAELARLGLNTNPGSSNLPELVAHICDTCSIEAIREVYVQLVQDKDLIQGGIIIFDFMDVPSRDKQVELLTVSGDEIFLAKDTKLILVWNYEEDDALRQKYLDAAQKFYEQQGARFLPVKLRELQISDEEFEQLIAEADQSEPVAIKHNPDAKPRHILVSPDAFMVFYNDGTVRICAECIFNHANLQQLIETEAFSIYTEGKTGLVTYIPMDPQNEPVIVDFDLDPEIGKWYMLHDHIIEPSLLNP